MNDETKKTIPFENRELNLSLLLTPQEEGLISNEHGSENPYIYYARVKDHELLIYGTPHIHHIDQKLIATFNNFNPDFIFVEGTATLPTEIQTLEAAAQWGENGLIMFLAHQEGIPVISWDLDYKDLIEEVLEKFPEDAVIGWAVGQAYKHYKSTYPSNEITAETILEYMHDRMARVFPTELLTEEKLQNATKIHANKKVEELTDEDAEQLASPRYGNPTNEVNRYMIEKRDPNAITKIFDKAKKYKRVLAVAGSGHAITWKPVFENLFEEVEQVDVI